MQKFKYKIHKTNKQINKEKQTCPLGASPPYSAVQKYKNTTKYKLQNTQYKYTYKQRNSKIQNTNTRINKENTNRRAHLVLVQDSAVQNYKNTQIQNRNT